MGAIKKISGIKLWLLSKSTGPSPVSRSPIPAGNKKIDIAGIRHSLNDIKARFPEINERLKTKRENFTDKVLDNLLSAYEHLNVLLARKTEFQAMDIFDLNLKVHLGDKSSDYIEYNGMIINNKDQFCKGIGSLWKWYKNNLTASPWEKAAGVYVRTLSFPQLFFEGNHRTAALVMCYIFVNEGLPPFVLNQKNAVYFLDLSSDIKHSTKNLGFKLHISKLRGYQKELEGFLIKNYPPES